MTRDDRFGARLRKAIPDDPAARERAWRVVRAGYAAGVANRRRRPRRGLAILLASLVGGVTAVGVAAASAPDSGVGRWVRQVLDVGEREATSALVRLPGGGRLLAQAGDGVWVVSADGGRRRIGGFDGASWSPRGRFVVAWRGRVLSAVEPGGRTRWSLTRPSRIEVARWAPVDGFRIAYVAGGSLRVVNGDGTGDRRVAPALAEVAPAWRPDDDHVVAYADDRGRVTVQAVDLGRTLWRSRPVERLRQLSWSPSGGRLLVVTARRLLVFDRAGRVRDERSLPAGTLATSADWSPRGDSVAVLRHVAGDARSELLLLDRGLGRERRLLAGPGRLGRAEWSPDGRRLLVPWHAADQWLFLRPQGAGSVTAITGIARQFDAGSSTPAFPARVEWCCPDVRP